MNRRRFLQRTAMAGGFALASPGAKRHTQQPYITVLDEFVGALIKDQQIPGAQLAVTYAGRLVHARGYGYADAERQRPVQATDLFRIASISKSITATAVMQLIERGLLTADTRVWTLLEFAEPADARWKSVTVAHLLYHAAGWDRDKFDPMFSDALIANTLKTSLPIGITHIIRYMLARPLDFDPGSQWAYSNFGYCLLGRVIERVAKMPYERYVQQQVLAPLGIHRMRLGRTPASESADAEVHYFDDRPGTVEAVVGNVGEQVEVPYGGWALENMDSCGGWLGSAVDLIRFAAAFDNPKTCPILNERSIRTMFENPGGAAGKLVEGNYQGRGWFVWPEDIYKHHTATSSNGLIAGTASYLIRRRDSVNWAVLFNKRSGLDGVPLSMKFRDASAGTFNSVKHWPDGEPLPGLL